MGSWRASVYCPADKLIPILSQIISESYCNFPQISCEVYLLFYLFLLLEKTSLQSYMGTMRPTRLYNGCSFRAPLDVNSLICLGKS